MSQGHLFLFKTDRPVLLVTTVIPLAATTTAATAVAIFSPTADTAHTATLNTTTASGVIELRPFGRSGLLYTRRLWDT